MKHGLRQPQLGRDTRRLATEHANTFKNNNKKQNATLGPNRTSHLDTPFRQSSSR